MYPTTATIYARVPFTVADPGQLLGLTLRMQFEDGFIAYLNGQEIARSNAPANATFNSVALAPRTDTAATNALDFDVSESRGFLSVGTNVLAFHVAEQSDQQPRPAPAAAAGRADAQRPAASRATFRCRRPAARTTPASPRSGPSSATRSTRPPNPPTPTP